MAIDSYSLCPGGRGKKIRFCCPDHVKDLEQIDRMLEGEQFSAGLAFVDGLLSKRPDCACLKEAKCLFQRQMGLWEDAYATSKEFVASEPQNVVAQSELAMNAALVGNAREAVSALVDALEAVEGDRFPTSILQAMLTTGMAFFENGLFFQAAAIAKQIQTFAPEDRATNAFLYRCLHSETTPLMLKEITFDSYAPDDFPKKAIYDEAVRLIARGQWKKGRAMFESALDCADQWPNLYRNLGFVELWFVNEEKGREYLNRYLASPNADPEEAIDVEQFLLLSQSPSWDDVVYMKKGVYTLQNFDEDFQKLLSSKRLLASARLPRPEESETQPKMGFVVLNAAPLEIENVRSLADVPRRCGLLFVYGKRTTREAYAEIYLYPDAEVTADEVFNEALGNVPPVESFGDFEAVPVFWTLNASTPRLFFKDSDKLTEELSDKLFDELFDDFSERWFEHRYAALDGKSPKEALSEPGGERRVEALTRVVCELFSSEYNDSIAGKLRAKTNASAPEPVAPPTKLETQEETFEFFRRVPLWRWARLSVDKCATEPLAQLLQIASLVAPRGVKQKFAQEFLTRPQEETKYVDRATAYDILVDNALTARDFETALNYITEATELANTTGNSDAHWNVLEIMTRFQLREYEKVRALSQRFFLEHREEENEVRTLQEFFAQISANAELQKRAYEAYRLQNGGLGDASRTPTSEPKSDDKPSGLWTPDGSGPRKGNDGAQGGGSKLWIPD